MKQPSPVKVRVPKKKPEPIAAFPAHGDLCLNCGNGISNNFCSICGQSTTTHRLSIFHFVLHDMVHSFWHIDRGIVYTLKEVLIRPGYAAIDYIRGKRAGKFPILTLILLLIGLSLWMYNIHPPAAAESMLQITTGNEFGKQLLAFANHNVKWLLLGLLPVGSISTLIVFRRSRLNYTEHLVVNSYVFGGLLVLLVLIKLVMLALPATVAFMNEYKQLIGVLFYLMGYWQAYHRCYRFAGIIWRFAAIWMLNILLLTIIVTSALMTTLAIHPEWQPKSDFIRSLSDTTRINSDTSSIQRQ